MYTAPVCSLLKRLLTTRGRRWRKQWHHWRRRLNSTPVATNILIVCPSLTPACFAVCLLYWSFGPRRNIERSPWVPTVPPSLAGGDGRTRRHGVVSGACRGTCTTHCRQLTESLSMLFFSLSPIALPSVFIILMCSCMHQVYSLIHTEYQTLEDWKYLCLYIFSSVCPIRYMK